MIFRPFAIEKISIALKASNNLLNMHRFLSNSTENVPNKRIRTESPSELRACSATGTDQLLSPILTPSILTSEDIKIAQTISFDNWTSYSGIMYKFRSEVHAGNEVVAFDMDGTLIKTKSGKKFPVYEGDWMLWDPTVKTVLHQLHKDKKHLIIISNQNGITVSKVSKQSIQAKVDKIIQVIGVPMDFICAIEDDRFRKPRTGMWEFVQQARFPQLSSNTVKHMYVGDAAGRLKEGTRSKDFADTDYKFALNIGQKFATPEQFFLGSTSRLHCQLPHPGLSSEPQRLCDVIRPAKSLEEAFFLAPESRITTHIINTTTTTAATNLSTDSNITPATVSATTASIADDIETTTKSEIVLLVAPPACGKSTLSRRFEQGGYLRVNQDTLGSIDKCLETARRALMAQQRQSVCVDNTNTDMVKRQKWIELAKQCGVQIRAVCLRTPKEVCSVMNSFRLLDPTTLPEDRRKIEKIVINTYYKNAVFPTLREGFYRVDDVVPELVPPTDLQALRFFHMYLKA